MTSVLVIDDHPIVLQGCRRMLEDAGVTAVLEARDAVSGYKLYRRHHPSVVIVDLAMQGSGLGGLPLIRRINAHDPSTRILVFSMHSDPIIVARALEAGATGYVLKDTSPAELMKAFEPFMLRCIRRQLETMPVFPVCYCLGEGENFRYFSRVNERYGFFKEIIPLPHPRWVMQYRRKRIAEFADEYVTQLNKLDQ